MSAEVSAAGPSTRWRPVVLTLVGVVAVVTALDTALDVQTVVRRGPSVATIASSAGGSEVASSSTPSSSTPASATIASMADASAPDASSSTLAMETCSAASGSE